MEEHMRFMDPANEKQENQNRNVTDIMQCYSGQKRSASQGYTGLSQEMKEKYESLSGYSFEDVRVHYNSDMPARMQALAYTQGNQVYLMPGQERHLEHELGHVVQQKKGIVKPTGTIDGIPVNEDEALEAEASLYGKKACHSFTGEQDMQKGHKGSVVQRYKKAGGYTVAAEPGRPPGKRLLMVRDNEPGALYIHGTVKKDRVPGELGKLGILPGTVEVDSPLPDETPPGKFIRYEQNEIPEIINRVLKKRKIPEDRRSLFQKCYAVLIDPTTKEYVPQQKDSQPHRNRKAEGIAEGRLEKQRVFLESCLADGGALRTLIQERAEIGPEQAGRWEEYLNRLLRAEDDEEYVSFNALGSDVYNDINAIYGVAGQRHRRTEDDCLQALDIAMDDLRYRLNQVEQEKRTVIFMPQIPTACNTSAAMRSLLINGVNNEKCSVKADFSMEEGNPYDEIVNWNYHYATSIPAGALTNDMLIVEDAIGKSHGERELMNAHWAAHIYGDEERDDVQGIALDSLQPVAGQQGVFRGLSRCRFNQMSDVFRENFCTSHNIGQDHSWSMNYTEYSDDNVYGTLKFYVDANWKIVYELEPAPDRSFTPGMQHFLISTADAIAEDFVLMEFAGKNDEEYSMDSRRLKVCKIPETRYDRSHCSLEEMCVVHPKKK